jgi:hypothetical protein
MGTAVCLSIVIVLVVRRTGPASSIPANELLVRSAIVELPPNRTITLRLGGRSMVRQAVLLSGSVERDPELAHVAMLFDEARYSWREPLSARSFQSWRSGLREKRDSVTVIHGLGPDPAYRVRTDTAAGILRSAALTLRAKDLHPTDGAFQFEGEEALQIEETAAPVLPQALQRAPAERKYEPKSAPAESPASPADTLHVLAALNAIGADVGEPIEVAEDSEQVLVRAPGLSPERARQVVAVLEPLPHVRVVLSAADGHPFPAQTAITERSSTGMPGTLRQRFEDRLGGAVAFQEVTDRVLEAGGLAVARTHALELLATRFSAQTEAGLAEADRALLRRLRQMHIAALDELTTRIAKDLETILPPGPLPDGRGSERDLVAAVQQVDDSLNRLLAGSYSESSGEALLNGLAGQLANLRRIIELRKESGR